MLKHNTLNAAILVLAGPGPQEGGDSRGGVPESLDRKTLQVPDTACRSMILKVFGTTRWHMGSHRPVLPADFMAVCTFPVLSSKPRKDMP